MALRETKNFVAEPARGGKVRIRVKVTAYPKSRIVLADTWEELKRSSDSTFDMSCVWDLGIGVFVRR
jgi:hypothetical protein